MPTYLKSSGFMETGVGGARVTVAYPPDNFKTTSTTVVVTGTALPGVTVTINGVPVTLDESGSFSYEIALSSGDNIITIVATDAIGSETVTRTVTQSEPLPIPDWAVPALMGLGFVAVAAFLLMREKK